MSKKLLTVGQLAKQVGVRTSTLRFYEDKELLIPNGRSESGYRLYKPEAADRVRLIQRAQRLGFSLADIRPLLNAWSNKELNNESVITTAKNRFVELEKQMTQLMVLQHELELFLQDLHEDDLAGSIDSSSLDHLLATVYANPHREDSSTAMLAWLLQQTGCNLTSASAQKILDRLRGLHVHIWQEEDVYQILIVSQDPAVAEAVNELTQLEASCEAHPHRITPQLTYGDEGYLLSVGGDNAFIFARLFLALEKESNSETPQTHNQLKGPYQ